ncbi:MAG: hypothetical protein KF723_21420 [Rhizobiaceae bacterium]|nr:hypothetical protein [Rhizobiaceae bacterium]
MEIWGPLAEAPAPPLGTLPHQWVGHIFGTNTGNLFVEIRQPEGASQHEVRLRLMDHVFGLSIYQGPASFDGALRIAMGLAIALSEDSRALAANYLGSKTTGEVINGGLEMLVFGIALGILTEISRAVRKDPLSPDR